MFFLLRMDDPGIICSFFPLDRDHATTAASPDVVGGRHLRLNVSIHGARPCDMSDNYAFRVP